MAQILVRNIPDAVKSRLVRQANRNRRSLEAEVRAILATASDVKHRNGTLVDSIAADLDGIARLSDGDWKQFEQGLKDLGRVAPLTPEKFEC